MAKARVLLVGGARPNFMKVSALYRAFARHGWLSTGILHTGQHASAEMSGCILADLGLHKLRLLTNNPKKIIGLKSYGLEIVEQVAIKIKPNKNNKKYLETKRTKLGHLLDL